MIDLAPYPPIPQGLDVLSNLNDQQHKILREAVFSPRAFDRSLSRCEQLAQQLKPERAVREVWAMLTSLRFLYDRCREWREEGREVADALWEFLEFTGLNQKVGSRDSPSYKRLLELVATNAGVEQRRKLRWLRSGILPNAMSFASFVDLRPNFSADRSSVQELVPIVIFRILAESDDSGPKGTVFQLTPEALGNLKKAVEDTERKLSALKSDAAFADRLFALSMPDQDEDEDD